MYITLNSKFRPFTYDELVKPLQDYGEAYREVEEQYATLAEQTEAWKNIANQENSNDAYEMYKKYSADLNAAIEDFSRGMTIQNRSKLAGLKSRYYSEIKPIDNAYKAVQEANKYRDTVKAEDGSAIFVIDRYNSLDDFLNGKQANNTFVSGDEIRKNVAARVLSQSYTDYNNLINNEVNPDKAIQIITSGNTQSIAAIIADEKSSLGIDSFDTQGQVKLNNAILSGVKQGLGSFASKEYMSKAERDASARSWNSLDLNNRQFNFNLQKSGYKLENGKPVIDTDNPVWAAEGITFEKNSDGSIKKDSNNNPIPIPNPEKEEGEAGTVETYQKGTITTKDGIVNLENFKKTYPKGGSYVEFDDLDQNSQNLLETFYPDMTLAQRRNYRYSIYKNSEGKVAGIEPIEKTTKKEEKVSNKDLTNVSFVE